VGIVFSEKKEKKVLYFVLAVCFLLKMEILRQYLNTLFVLEEFKGEQKKSFLILL
jgi:hypothetical protein